MYYTLFDLYCQVFIEKIGLYLIQFTNMRAFRLKQSYLLFYKTLFLWQDLQNKLLYL